MKKIVLGVIILLGVLFGNIVGVFAEGNYKGQPVFKIYNHTYNKGNKMYYAQSSGSAVYLGNNIIVTNNHVVKDEKIGYTGFYEICETIDFTKNPVCFTSAKLLYVDKSKDLAFLKLETKPNSDKKMEFSDKKISIGDKIGTYGYPSNGGKTITFTSGKISGFESEKYKIDASIDSGSSGGGVFDIDGKLVGITTSVVSGYTTLGYLVPTKDVKSFLLKKGNITNIKAIDTIRFKEFLGKYHKRINSDEISTEYINVKNISKYGFSISENMFDDNDELNKFFLSSKTGYTVISIHTHILNTKDTKFNEEDYKKLTKILNLKFTTEQFIYNNGKEFHYSLELNKKTNEIKIIFSRYAIKYEISGYLDEKDEIKNAILLLFKDSKIKFTSNYNDILFVDGVKINKNSGFESVKYLGKDLVPKIHGLKKVGQNTILQLMTGNYKLIKPEQMPTLTEVLEKAKKLYYQKNIYTSNFINNKGRLFHYIKVNYKNFIFYKFTTEAELDGYLYNYNFNIYIHGNENTNIDSSIKQFINSLEFEGKSFFPTKDIKESGIKKISEITFKNNPKENIYNSDFGKDFTLNISEKEALKILQEISGKSIIFSDIEDKNSVEFKFKNSIKLLLQTKNGKKYIDKFSKIIPKLTTNKLKNISKKINQLDLNNKKFKKYREILTYLKYIILFELEEKN